MVVCVFGPDTVKHYPGFCSTQRPPASFIFFKFRHQILLKQMVRSRTLILCRENSVLRKYTRFLRTFEVFTFTCLFFSYSSNIV